MGYSRAILMGVSMMDSDSACVVTPFHVFLAHSDVSFCILGSGLKSRNGAFQPVRSTGEDADPGMFCFAFWWCRSYRNSLCACHRVCARCFWRGVASIILS